jgi:hypothetical protein
LDFKILFYLPYPGFTKSPHNTLIENGIEFYYSKYIKVKDSQHKFSFDSILHFSEPTFCFYYSSDTKQRFLEITVDTNYYRSLKILNIEEKQILALIKECLLPESKAVKHISLALGKLVEYELDHIANMDYVNRWVQKVFYYLNKTMEELHYKSSI